VVNDVIVDSKFYLLTHVLMFELFMYMYSCNTLSARFFDVDRALNSYFMIIMIMIMSNAGNNEFSYDSGQVA